VEATARIEGRGYGLTLRAEVLDGSDRVIVRQENVPVRDGRAEISLPLERTREQYHVLQVWTVRDGMEVDVRREQFYVLHPPEEDLVVFTDGENRNLQGWRRYGIFRRYGINTVQLGTGGGGMPDPRMALAAGMEASFRVWLTHCHPATGGCLSSDTYHRELRRSFRERAKWLKPYGLRFMSTGDDSGTGRDFCETPPIWVRSFVMAMARQYDGDHGRFAEEHELGRGWGSFRYMTWHAKLKDIKGLDLLPGEMEALRDCWERNYDTIEDFNRASGTDFDRFEHVGKPDLQKLRYVSPCMLGFRDAMKERYGSIDKLNAAWGTGLKDFSGISNDLIERLSREGKYGAKLDKTWYLEDLFIRHMHSASAGVHEVVPTAGVGQGAASFGNIIPEVLGELDSAMPYKGPRDFEIIRSVPHRYSGQTIGVYGGKKVPASARENQAWETLFTGGNFIWFWSMCTGGLHGDLSMNPGRSGMMLENIREMQKGIGRALVRADRLHDGIAILHSRRAGALGRVVKDLGSMSSSQVGFQRIIEDLGLQYRYTWTEEVEAGGLRGGEFKVLILPYTQILSPQEVEEIRRFVRAGGAVIADFRPGTRDWNGSPREAGALDGVFGVKQDCSEAATVKAPLKWLREVDGSPRKNAASVQGIRGDGTVEAGSATALGSVGEAPAVLIKTYGEGMGVFLNFSPTTYNVLLNRDSAGPLRRLCRGILARAGVERHFRVVDADGEDVYGAELAVFRAGPVRYLTLEKKSYQFEEYPIEAAIELDGEYDVYNAREGEAVGQNDRIPVSLRGLGCYVYALLPYRVEGFLVDCPETVRRGGEATVSMHLETDGGAPGPHTIRVDVLRPDGERLWPMHKKELEVGRAEVVLPIAFNEEPGTWTVKVTDVTTGMSETRHLNIKE
jgi:hypothetical protein